MTTVRAQAEGASFGGGGREERKWGTKAMRPSALMVGRFSLETLNVMLLSAFFRLTPYDPSLIPIYLQNSYISF